MTIRLADRIIVGLASEGAAIESPTPALAPAAVPAPSTSRRKRRSEGGADDDSISPAAKRTRRSHRNPYAHNTESLQQSFAANRDELQDDVQPRYNCTEASAPLTDHDVEFVHFIMDPTPSTMLVSFGYDAWGPLYPGRESR